MNEELNKALDQISDKHIDEAATRQRKGFPWIRSIAAVLALVIACTAVWAAFDSMKPSIVPESTGSILQGPTPGNPSTPSTPTTPSRPTIPAGPRPEYPTNLGGIQSPSTLQLSSLVSGPTYPQMAQYPNSNEVVSFSKEFYELEEIWSAGHAVQYNQPKGYADSLNAFWSRSIAQFLSGEGNRAYSPANVYLALAMLAETTDGNSRQQVLDLLGADSIETLRTQAGHVWNAQYCDDGQSTSLLANSLWLDDSYIFKESTVQNLVNNYYTSVFNGDLGTDYMNDQLRSWINSQTGGLLQEQTKETIMTDDTFFALVSTVYFASDWKNEFSKKYTTDGIFHCKDGDLTTAFMNNSFYEYYYWGSNFGAVQLALNKGSMWLILPDEGVPVEEVLASDEYMTMILSPSIWKNRKDIEINLSLPKFDISSQTDLIDGMKKLGLTDIFTPGVANFSPITEDPTLQNPYVGKIDHAVRVAIDEEGVVAAAYTVLRPVMGGMPPENEIDFVLDRPFLFLVTDDVPLFAGVVEQP